MKHGESSAYHNGCRCEECKAYKARENARYKGRAYRVKRHDATGYRYGCRCDKCKEAKRSENKVSNRLRYPTPQEPRQLRKNPKTARERRLQKYGLTLSDYESMKLSQRGLCAICRDKPGSRGLVVDHCHNSGNVRELLCDSCNKALGFAKDNPDVLRRMADYVERYTG